MTTDQQHAIKIGSIVWTVATCQFNAISAIALTMTHLVKVGTYKLKIARRRLGLG